MKEIPPDDSRPEWLITNQAERTFVRMISVDGATYPYTIIKHGIIRPELPYAVGFDKPDELFISENVPYEDHPYILAHEVREKTTFSADPEEDRCTLALAVEFEEVEKSRRWSEYGKYVKRRTDYFTAALRYYQNPQHATGVSENFRQGLLLATGFASNIARSFRM